MRKWLLAPLLLLLLLAGAATVGWFYVSPSRQLDLSYEEVPLRDRALDMAKRLSLELVLSEADVNNLGKKQLASTPEFEPGVVVTGADFLLADGLLVADVNAKWKERVPFGLRIAYRLSWQAPNLVAEVAEAKLKGIDLPADRFEKVVMPIGDKLPAPLKVRSVEVRENRIVVTFAKPSLGDLRKLFG